MINMLIELKNIINIISQHSYGKGIFLTESKIII